MAAPNRLNILKSNALTYIAAAGEALPTATQAAGIAWGGNWVRLGYTQSALVFTYTEETYDIVVEESLAPVRRFKTAHSANFSVTLAELEDDYMEYVTQSTLADSTTYTDIEVNDAQVLMKEYSIGFEGYKMDASENERPIRCFFTVANVTMNGSINFSKRGADNANIPLIAHSLADTADSGKVIQWQQVVTVS